MEKKFNEDIYNEPDFTPTFQYITIIILYLLKLKKKKKREQSNLTVYLNVYLLSCESSDQLQNLNEYVCLVFIAFQNLSEIQIMKMYLNDTTKVY